MSKILIIFYTGYGNIAEMAEEITKGAKEVPRTAIFH
jgi:flavodoxin